MGAYFWTNSEFDFGFAGAGGWTLSLNAIGFYLIFCYFTFSD